MSISEYKALASCGWRTAPEIIERWNAQNGTDEFPTIAGQILARLGLHEQGFYRTPKASGRPCLYSPAAQSIITDELQRRLIAAADFQRVPPAGRG